MPPRITSRRTSVIVEEPAKTLTPVNAADTIHRRCAIDQLVTEALVITLAVVVLGELRDRVMSQNTAERSERANLPRAGQPKELHSKALVVVAWLASPAIC